MCFPACFNCSGSEKHIWSMHIWSTSPAPSPFLFFPMRSGLSRHHLHAGRDRSKARAKCMRQNTRNTWCLIAQVSFFWAYAPCLMWTWSLCSLPLYIYPQPPCWCSFRAVNTMLPMHNAPKQTREFPTTTTTTHLYACKPLIWFHTNQAHVSRNKWPGDPECSKPAYAWLCTLCMFCTSAASLRPTANSCQ